MRVCVCIWTKWQTLKGYNAATPSKHSNPFLPFHTHLYRHAHELTHHFILSLHHFLGMYKSGVGVSGVILLLKDALCVWGWMATCHSRPSSRKALEAWGRWREKEKNEKAVNDDCKVLDDLEPDPTSTHTHTPLKLALCDCCLISHVYVTFILSHASAWKTGTDFMLRLLNLGIQMKCTDFI